MSAITAESKTTTYFIIFTLTGSDEQRSCPVLITEGYSTLADVEKIISIPRGLDAADVTVLGIFDDAFNQVAR